MDDVLLLRLYIADCDLRRCSPDRLKRIAHRLLVFGHIIDVLLAVNNEYKSEVCVSSAAAAELAVYLLCGGKRAPPCRMRENVS